MMYPHDLRYQLARLHMAHQDLDQTIRSMERAKTLSFELHRLKKEKLVLKERIQEVENALLPDIIA